MVEPVSDEHLDGTGQVVIPRNITTAPEWNPDLQDTSRLAVRLLCRGTDTPAFPHIQPRKALRDVEPEARRSRTPARVTTDPCKDLSRVKAEEPQGTCQLAWTEFLQEPLVACESWRMQHRICDSVPRTMYKPKGRRRQLIHRQQIRDTFTASKITPEGRVESSIVSGQSCLQWDHSREDLRLGIAQIQAPSIVR